LTFNPNIFVFVLYSSDAGFVATVKSCMIMLNFVHRGFVDLKLLSHWVGSETSRSWEWRTSGVVTEISWWRRREFFNYFLPVFSFPLQNWFSIPFLTTSW